MTFDTIQSILAWSLLINFVILLIWVIAFAVASDFIYKVHSRWFSIKRESFDSIHYGGMAFYKMAIVLFNFAPYIAMRIVGE